jgi:magnesium-transporting ATPase (P-type)
MTVRTVLTAEGRFDVSGAAYRPEGEFEINGTLVEPAAHPTLIEAATAAILCNDADLRDADGMWTVQGDPMEGALVSLGVKAGHDAALLRKQLPRTDEIPFDTQHQFMATLHHSHEDGTSFAYIKGLRSASLPCAAGNAGIPAINLSTETFGVGRPTPSRARAGACWPSRSKT